MYLNNSAVNPTPAPRLRPIPNPKATPPDYLGLVRFLIEPLLEFPETLSLDCEMSQGNTQVWIRMAFEGDKGRVFGRGGRNFQAIRIVLDAVARSVGQSVHLDIYGGIPQSTQEPEMEGRTQNRRYVPRRSSPSPRQNNHNHQRFRPR